MHDRERIALLRQHETECYSICFYLLQDESLALRAAEAAMLKLYRSDAFCRSADAAERRRLVRKAALSCAFREAGG